MKQSIQILLIITILTGLTSCGRYTRLLKSQDIEKKYQAAINYYDHKQCAKALGLLEELVSMYRGTEKAEKVYYYYANANFCVQDYIAAGYNFRNYVKTFPNGAHAEECAYMSAYCYYLESPNFSLDQTDTKNAIREMQLFINRYPSSQRVEEANKIIDKLRDKLEKKAFNIAKQYYDMEDYKAAIVSFNNMLKDFPDTKYAEDALFLTLKANYLLARNSIEKKKEDRYKDTIDVYFKFNSAYPESKYKKEAADLYNSAVKAFEKFKSQS